MDIYSASEILQFAIKTEEDGERFYRNFANTIPEEKAKALFTFLAEEEEKHKKSFEKMLSKVESYKPAESYPDEYYAYLRALVEDVIFSKERLEREVMGIRDAVSALNFGLRREVDSIFYYQEIKKLVPDDQQKIVEKIIEEERGHFAKIHELKKLLYGKA